MFQNIIGRTGFKIAEDKVHFCLRDGPQVVTGLIVNDRMRPSQEFIQELKRDIRDCLEFGPCTVADEKGLTLVKLKLRLNGRICHLANSDRVIAKILRGRMCGINWHRD